MDKSSHVNQDGPKVNSFDTISKEYQVPTCFVDYQIAIDCVNWGKPWCSASDILVEIDLLLVIRQLFRIFLVFLEEYCDLSYQKPLETSIKIPQILSSQSKYMCTKFGLVFGKVLDSWCGFGSL